MMRDEEKKFLSGQNKKKYYSYEEEIADRLGLDDDFNTFYEKKNNTQPVNNNSNNVISKDSTSSPGNKTSEILSKLENGIKEAMNSERYKAFLRMQTNFHNYSFNNSMLIYLQRPSATRVAGFNTWKKLERHVMKGEKGITILAPNPYKYNTLVNKVDPKTKEPVRDPSTGKIVKVKSEVTALSFKPVTVFDVKQTDGKPLPEICNELQGNSINAEGIIKAIKQISDVPVVEKNIESGAKGYYSRSENIIAMQQGMSLDQTAKTLIHEYAHSQLHNSDAAAFLDRSTKEVQAESVAFIVSERFGIDTSEYSFEYLANWSSGKELSELKASFDVIQKTADKTIQALEEVFIKEKELETSAVLKEKIIELYSKEFPAIKHITLPTAEAIDELNKKHEDPYSIKDIKQEYKHTGKLYEASGSITDKEAFMKLQTVVDDLKHAQLVEKKIQSQEKAAIKQIDKDMDMVR